MSDDFEDLLKRWLRDRAGNDRSALEALAGNVAALPPHRRRLTPGLPLAASIVVVLGLILLVAPRSGGVGNEASAAPIKASQGAVLPGGPGPYVNLHDARLGRCFGAPDDMEFVFEMTHARDYRRYIPAALRAPELEVDDPAFVVVYRDGWEGPVFGGVPGADRPTPIPGRRLVCVLVRGGEPNLYGDVDISGLTINVVPSEPSTSATPDPPPTDSPSTTPEPAPAWTVDLVGQLECDGPAQTIGGEIGELTPVGGSGTASPWEWLYAEDVVDLPLEGWIEDPKVRWEIGASDIVRFVNVVDGRVKAVMIMGGHSVDGGLGHWEIVAFRACPPDEYDQLRGRTTDDAPWVDAAGQPATEVRAIVGPAHCGNESTVWLFLDDGSRLYLRDPLGVLRDVWVGDYLGQTTLPADAVSTGLRSRDRELFTTPDQDFVYIRTPAGIERWPRSKDPFIGCA